MGLPGAGKSWVRRLLAAALGLPHVGIDDMRLPLLRPGQSWPHGRDDEAWTALAETIAAHPAGIVVENAGGRDLEALADRDALTILCRADEPARRARLEERVRSGYPFARGRRRYVEDLLAGEELPTDGNEVVIDTLDPTSIGSAIAIAAAWLGGETATAAPTARVAWPAPRPHSPRRPDPQPEPQFDNADLARLFA